MNHIVGFTVDQYRALFVNNYFTQSQSVRLGKRASQICENRGHFIFRQPRTIVTIHGEEKNVYVNSYPKNVLDLAVKEVL